MSDEREPGGDGGVIGPLPTEELRTKTSLHRNKALRKIYRGVTRVFRVSVSIKYCGLTYYSEIEEEPNRVLRV